MNEAVATLVISTLLCRFHSSNMWLIASANSTDAPRKTNDQSKTETKPFDQQEGTNALAAIRGCCRNGRTTGTFTVTDNGLAVVANTAASNITSVTFGATGTNKALTNALTAGHWMDYIDFTTSLTDGSSHTVTVTIRSNTGPLGSTTLVSAQTATLVAPGASSTAKITIYLDLGVTSITAPLTTYVTVS